VPSYYQVPQQPLQPQGPPPQVYKTVMTTTTTYYTAEGAEAAQPAATPQPQPAQPPPPPQRQRAGALQPAPPKQPNTAAVLKPALSGSPAHAGQTFVGSNGDALATSSDESGARRLTAVPPAAAAVADKQQQPHTGHPQLNKKTPIDLAASDSDKPATAAVLSPELQAAVDKHNELRCVLGAVRQCDSSTGLMCRSMRKVSCVDSQQRTSPCCAACPACGQQAAAPGACAGMGRCSGRDSPGVGVRLPQGAFQHAWRGREHGM
jgi:hypothetical protein